MDCVWAALHACLGKTFQALSYNWQLPSVCCFGESDEKRERQRDEESDKKKDTHIEIEVQTEKKREKKSIPQHPI